MNIPDPPSFEQKVWCSYIEGRSPEYKLHANRGQAFNACGYLKHHLGMRGTIWYLTPDGWDLKFHWENLGKCAVCNQGFLGKDVCLAPDDMSVIVLVHDKCKKHYKSNKRLRQKVL